MAIEGNLLKEVIAALLGKYRGRNLFQPGDHRGGCSLSWIFVGRVLIDRKEGPGEGISVKGKNK